jgi:hypothetical protein
MEFIKHLIHSFQTIIDTVGISADNEVRSMHKFGKTMYGKQATDALRARHITVFEKFCRINATQIKTLNKEFRKPVLVLKQNALYIDFQYVFSFMSDEDIKSVIQDIQSIARNFGYLDIGGEGGGIAGGFGKLLSDPKIMNAASNAMNMISKMDMNALNNSLNDVIANDLGDIGNITDLLNNPTQMSGLLQSTSQIVMDSLSKVEGAPNMENFDINSLAGALGNLGNLTNLGGMEGIGSMMNSLSSIMNGSGTPPKYVPSVTSSTEVTEITILPPASPAPPVIKEDNIVADALSSSNLDFCNNMDMVD